MKRISLFVLMFIIFTTSLFTTGYAADSSLSADLIEQIRSSFQMDRRIRAMRNSVTNNSINELALNRDVLNGHNEVFSNKVETKGITNQKQSGRCWLFAGLNVLRPIVIEKYNLEEFEFSQNYLTFWDKMEKANTFLETIIELRDRDLRDRKLDFYLHTPLPDGGYWENVVNLIEKYGVVPKTVMSETTSSEGTALMNRVIQRKLRADAVKLRKMHDDEKGVEQMREKKKKMLADIYKMLVINLGQPPEQFDWRYEDANSIVSELKTYTPKSFYEEFVAVDLRQYVDLYNDSSRDYGNHYEVEGTKDLYDGENVHFANVDIQTLKDIALKALLDDQPVWFGADVGKDQDKEQGIMAVGLYDYESIFDVDLKMTKAQRSLYRESTVNHAMVFTAVDLKDDKPLKWKVENSWGDEKGSKGYWTLYDSWFDENVYSIIVKKKYVPEDILKIFEKKPIVLPPWDPIWSDIRR